MSLHKNYKYDIIVKYLMKGMGSMKKRIMAALLVLCMVFSLAGCVEVQYVPRKVI